MAPGIIAGLLAGALWGLAFVAPVAVAPLTPFDLTVVRYLTFGAGSLAVLAHGRLRVLARLRPGDYALLLALGFAGNAGFYLALSLALKLADATAVTLLVGCLPVTMAIAGSIGTARMSARRLLFPIGLILAGLVIVSGRQAAASVMNTGQTNQAGLALALTALALWTWFGVRSARLMVQRQEMSTLEWTALIGLASAVLLVVLVPAGLFTGLWDYGVVAAPRADLLRLIAWGVALGAASSWAANWAWAYAAKRLPVTLAGQLIVSETMFGLLYNHIYHGTLPAIRELAGVTLLLAGVILAITALQRSQRS